MAEKIDLKSKDYDDGALLEVVYDGLFFYPIDGKKFNAAPPPVKNVLAMLTLHYEVLNGGFAQFYFNGCGDYQVNFADAFKEAGLDGIANVVAGAQKCFDGIKHTVPKDKTDVYAFSRWCDGNPLCAFDDEYEKTQEETEAKIAKYIRDNIKFFSKQI